MSKNSIRDSVLNTYSIEHWSDGYVDVSADGRVLIRPDAGDSSQHLCLLSLIEQCRNRGLGLPLLIRFPGILQHRINRLCDTFNDAAEKLGYQGRYTAVYPVKVNQQRRVVEALTTAAPASAAGHVGLEAGSKPELLAVLSLAPAGFQIVCNGYKDREFVRLALLGQAMGHRVFIVVEKPNELDLVLQEAEDLGVEPVLGVRVRLASIGKGNWQNTGGEKSKFGLSASQLLQLLERMRQAGRQHCLKMLHFHLGSQIANLRDIQQGLRECARFFQDLGKMGLAIEVVDVGGGLGIDYEGTRSRSACSSNYSTAEYALHVLRTFRDAADEQGLPHPDIITESGRAMTAHHAVLVTDVVDRESVSEQPPVYPAALQAETSLLRDLIEDLACIDGQRNRSLLEIHNDAAEAVSEAQARFTHGSLDLESRALAEQLYLQICWQLRSLLNPGQRNQRELLDTLNEKTADRIFANFSLFQSLPDIWGIDQVFPILPLKGLDQPLSRRGVLRDITCDSDGRIDQYVDSEGVEQTLPMPCDHGADPQYLAFFLVGAYQEILGDLHNLFGDTDSVEAGINSRGEVTISAAANGETVRDVLRYVNYDADELLRQLRMKLARSSLEPALQRRCIDEMAAGLTGYTYFEH